MGCCGGGCRTLPTCSQCLVTQNKTCDPVLHGEQWRALKSRFFKDGMHSNVSTDDQSGQINWSDQLTAIIVGEHLWQS